MIQTSILVYFVDSFLHHSLKVSSIDRFFAIGRKGALDPFYSAFFCSSMPAGGV